MQSHQISLGSFGIIAWSDNLGKFWTSHNKSYGQIFLNKKEREIMVKVIAKCQNEVFDK